MSHTHTRTHIGALFEILPPSLGSNIVPRAHTASHRTHERNETISWFGGLSNDEPTPPTSDFAKLHC